VVKYYENIRLVYEVESRLQELKRATTSEEDNRPPAERKKTDNQKPDNERKQNYYSMERQNMLLANWSTTELKTGSNLLSFVAANATGNRNHFQVHDEFFTAELSSGLKPGKESGKAQNVCSGFGSKSSRSLNA
jgi:hypothetical protein